MAVVRIFFTIVSKNYLAYARTLMESVREHHPDAERYVCLADQIDGYFAPEKEPFRLLIAEDLGIPSFRRFAFRYDIMEFNTAVKPYVFRWLLDRTEARDIIYLDPDILVTSPLVEVVELLAAGNNIVLTPHITAPIEDDRLPGEHSFLKAGIYNLGFIAVRRAAEARRFVDWWGRRLEYGAVVDQERGLFTDQKWVDLVPALFKDVAILRHPGYNAAYWNLMDRRVERVAGKWMVEGKPLAFFHFSGVELQNPESFSKHQDRFNASDLGGLRPLYDEYLASVTKNGFSQCCSWPYVYGFLADGARILPPMRAYFRDKLDRPDSGVDDPFGLDEAFFNQPEPEFSGEGAPVVTRYLYGLSLVHREIRWAFDLASRNGRRAYVRQILDTGGLLFRVPERFLDPMRESSRLQDPELAMSVNSLGLIHRIVRHALAMVYRVYRAKPELIHYLLRFLSSKTKLRLREFVLRKSLASSPRGTLGAKRRRLASLAQHDSRGVTLVGYARGEFGVAEVARSTALALHEHAYPFEVFEITLGMKANNNDDRLQPFLSSESRHSVQLYCVNADQIRPVHMHLGPDFSAGRYRIAIWFWELARFPEVWWPAFDWVEEIWAPSAFVYEAVMRVSPKPVVHMPVAVDFGLARPYSRREFGLPEGKFLFLFSYDFDSYPARKNPEACIEAFQRAFPMPENGVGLVIKTMYGERHERAYGRLREIARSDPRISILNEVLPRDAVYGLESICDCFVSLHRSEGFGLGLAESMLLGKPVIATAYSGNMDFTHSDNACLVNYQLVPVPSYAYPHAAGQQWADPDIEQAVWYMRKLVTEPDFRSRVATAGQRYIQAHHSRHEVGMRAIERLNVIYRFRNQGRL